MCSYLFRNCLLIHCVLLHVLFGCLVEIRQFDNKAISETKEKELSNLNA